jgi:hypothetical protein
VLVRLDHVASFIVNANHSIMRTAETLGVIDRVADCVWLGIPKPAGMGARRRSDRHRVYLCAGALRKGVWFAYDKSFLDYGCAPSDDRRMNTVEEYKIIQGENLGSLAKEVNAALKEGWQPHGAPFVYVSGAAACCQAIVNFHQPTSAETIAKLRRAAVSAFRR